MAVTEPLPLPRRSLAGRVSLVLAGLIVFFALFIGIPVPEDRVPLAFVVSSLGAVILWAVLQARADRRAYEAEIARQAAEQSATEQRLQIARDLHDTVSHRLGTITLRAAVAARLPEQEEAGTVLADIESISREATDELRHMMGVLRSGERAPRAPMPGLTDIDGLIAEANDAGLQVRREGDDVGPVSDAVGATAYRLVQEALANVSRHAGPTDATVCIDRDDDDLVVSVTDGGPVPGWRAARGTGSGVAGMRERVRSLGGALDAGRHGPGWRVRARLPSRGTS